MKRLIAVLLFVISLTGCYCPPVQPTPTMPPIGITTEPCPPICGTMPPP